MYTHLWFTFAPRSLRRKSTVLVANNTTTATDSYRTNTTATDVPGTRKLDETVENGDSASAGDNEMAAQRSKVLLLMAYPSVYALVSIYSFCRTSICYLFKLHVKCPPPPHLFPPCKALGPWYCI
jgi:hypothetical protein